jgi:hypothetical protein
MHTQHYTHEYTHTRTAHTDRSNIVTHAINVHYRTHVQADIATRTHVLITRTLPPYICTYAHTYIHTKLHTWIRTYTYILLIVRNVHRYILKYLHTYIRSCGQTRYISDWVHLYILTSRTYAYTNIRTDTMDIRTHVQSYEYKRTYVRTSKW